jgi:predicted porin
LAATSAFADVSLVGTFDPTAVKTSTTYGAAVGTAGAKVDQTGMTYNGRGTSQITFKVKEDLGSGLSAIALMENDFQAQNKEDQIGKGADQGLPNAGVNFGSGGGEIYTGLTGSFGTMKLGAPNTATLSTQGGSVFGTKLGSGFGEGLHGSAKVRQSQTVQYETPTMSGFRAVYGRSFGQNVDAGQTVAAGAANTAIAGLASVGAIDDMGVFYVNGPLVAAVTYFKQAAADSTKVANTNLNYQASYAFGAAKLQVGAHSEKGVSGTDGKDNTGTFVSGTYDIGAVKLLAQVANRKDKYATNAAAPQNLKMTSLGVDYSLSKMTTLYARYSNYTMDNNVTTTVFSKQTKTAAGLQINF